MNTRAMTDKLQNLQQRASETARNMGTVTDGYVRDNIWTSVALAALLGCVLGYLLTKRGD